MLIVDAHLDLSMNAMEWNRDLTRPIDEIRSREKDMTDKPDRGKGVVSFDELRRGNIGLVVATQIARYVSPQNPLPGWHSPEQAWAQTQAQLAWYKSMEELGELRQIHSLRTLEDHLHYWAKDQSPKKTIGYILSLEGADSIVTLKHLERAYNDGLRAVGPAHYGPGRYAQGTDATGGIGNAGRALLKEMERLNIILDATLVPHNRQYSDEQIKELIQRDAVIGSVMDAWMLIPNWVRGVSTPQATNCSLKNLIDHMDHICQLAGNTKHVAIGSDLDGAFGKEQCPTDIETIADLQKIPTLLSQRGYKKEDIENITSKNWLRFLRKAWM